MPEGPREERDLHPMDLTELGAAEGIVLHRVLARLAQVDRGADAVAQHRRPSVRGQSAQVVGADQRMTTGGVSVTGGEAAEIARVETGVPVEQSRIGGHGHASGRCGRVSSLRPKAKEQSCSSRAATPDLMVP